MPFLLLFKGLFDPKTYIALANFFVKNWKAIVVILLLAMVSYQNFSSVRFVFGVETVPALLKDVDELTENNIILQNNNEILVGTINQRNEELVKWEELTAKLEKQMEELEGDIIRIKEETDQEVEDILNQPTPQTCEKAIEYLIDGVDDLEW